MCLSLCVCQYASSWNDQQDRVPDKKKLSDFTAWDHQGQSLDKVRFFDFFNNGLWRPHVRGTVEYLTK